MKTKKINRSVLFIIMLVFTIVSCSPGKGDIRDRNLEQSILDRLDTIPGVRYVGMSDSHELDGDKFQTVVIYYVTDSVGIRTEYNVRVTTNNDCSEIFSWEELDYQILGDVKQKVSDKMREKGVRLDGNLIDALIELKKR